MMRGKHRKGTGSLAETRRQLADVFVESVGGAEWPLGWRPPSVPVLQSLVDAVTDDYFDAMLEQAGAYSVPEDNLATTLDADLAEEMRIRAEILTVLPPHKHPRPRPRLPANSAVCYALGITNTPPRQMGLLFERFLAPRELSAGHRCGR